MLCIAYHPGHAGWLQDELLHSSVEKVLTNLLIFSQFTFDF